MGIIVNQTENKVLRIVARCLKLLNKTDRCRVSKTDNFEIHLAKSMLQSVITNNPQIIEIKSSEK